MVAVATTVNMQTVSKLEQTVDNSAGRGHDIPGKGHGWSDNVLTNPAFDKDRVNFPDLPGNTPVFTPPGSGFDAAVPVPAAIWLFGSGLLGLIGLARRRKH